MSKKSKRISYLIHMLCDLSRNGWSNATCADWQPLEAELAKLMENK